MDNVSNNQTFYALIAAVVVVVALLTYVVIPKGDEIPTAAPQTTANQAVSQRETVTEATNAAENPSSDLLEQRMNELETKLGDINEQLSTLNEVLANLSDSSGDSVVENIEAPIPLSAEEIEQFKDDRVQKLEELVNPGISFDPQWSSQTESNVSAKFTENEGLALATNSEVQCGATACKVSATLPESMPASQRDAYQMAMILGLSKDLPHATSGGFVKESDGSYTLSLYMSRAGHTLPSADIE